MVISMIKWVFLAVSLIFCYAIYQRKKQHNYYVERKEGDHRKFNDRNKPYWNK